MSAVVFHRVVYLSMLDYSCDLMIVTFYFDSNSCPYILFCLAPSVIFYISFLLIVNFGSLPHTYIERFGFCSGSKL